MQIEKKMLQNFQKKMCPHPTFFAVCQLALIFETDWKLKAHDELLAFFFVHTFAMLSTITNPILYGWLNTNLKHLFRAMIPTVRNEREEREAEMFKLTSKVVEDGRSITQL